MKSFGRTIADARKDKKISQKDLASRIRKEDGTEISAQYLNDIEHDRRNPPGESMIRQLARELDLEDEADYLCLLAGTIPQDIRERGTDNPDQAKKFFTAFRRRVG
jgi:transcriptional regulator with XRE-family HTH domain